MEKTAICIPIVSNTIQELKQDIKSIQALPYDCIEWRIDCVQEDESIIDMAKMIRSSFMCPILATIRTFAHKGYWNRDKEAYFDLYAKLVDMHVVDWVDLESDLANLPQVTWFHKHGIRVIFSYHTFEAGIGRDAIFQLYNQCLACGADVLKIASMPATIQEMTEQMITMYDISLFNKVGVICIGMSEAGKISRVIGGLFGSILTFASANKKSAPNQIGAKELKQYLELIDAS